MSPRDQLSYREIQVATMVWEGKTNPEIASILGSTEHVVKNQLRGVFDKLGVWSRLELALYVAGHGGAKWAEADTRPIGANGEDGHFQARTALSAILIKGHLGREILNLVWLPIHC